MYTCTCTCAVCVHVHVQYMWVSWVRVPPEAARFSPENWLPWVCCVALPCCLFDLACFFLPFFSSLIKHVYTQHIILSVTHRRPRIWEWVCPDARWAAAWGTSRRARGTESACSPGRRTGGRWRQEGWWREHPSPTVWVVNYERRMSNNTIVLLKIKMKTIRKFKGICTIQGPHFKCY